ncbi:MAG: hypothetical protein ABR964_05990 [Tepidisphaeraceae bacterium]|jgi:hypothetical protein
MPNFREIKDYLTAFKNDWISIFGGPLSIILTFAALYVRSTTLSRLEWTAAAICFVAASYRVWLGEYRKGKEHPLAKDIEEEVNREMSKADETDLLLITALSRGKRLNDDLTFSLTQDHNAMYNLPWKITFVRNGADGFCEIVPDYLRAVQLWIASHPKPDERRN